MSSFLEKNKARIEYIASKSRYRMNYPVMKLLNGISEPSKIPVTIAQIPDGVSLARESDNTFSINSQLALASDLQKNSNLIFPQSIVENNKILYIQLDAIASVGMRLSNFSVSIPVDRIISMLEKTLIALNELHSAGFVHGDIRPSMIYLFNDGTLRLSCETFPLLISDLMVPDPKFTPKTVAGATESASATQENDIWSLAAIIYSVAFGLDASLLDDLDKLIHGHELYAILPEQIRKLLALMLNPDSSARPSAKDVIDSLESFKRGEFTLPKSVEKSTNCIVSVTYHVGASGPIPKARTSTYVTYSGFLVSNSLPVTIKVPNGIGAAALELETRPMIKLSHRNLVKVFGISEVPKVTLPFEFGIVMESMPYSFREILPKLKTGIIELPENLRSFADPKLRLQMVLQVCHGLKYLHENMYYHTNIKPDNIGLNPDSKFAKIADMTSILPNDVAMVSRGIRGSPIYMCPALASGTANVDDKTDIYSLGVTMWEVLTLGRPYESLIVLSVNDFFAHVRAGTRPCSESVLSALEPSGIGNLIADCWHTEPIARPNITTVISRLTEILA